MSYNYVFFDLDGTLTDPAEGITNSVEYALNYYGIKVENKKELECFIGPPLYASFEKYYGFSHHKAIEAVEKYREYFSDKGIFENRLYKGTEEFLGKLKKEGKKIILATSKPEVYAVRILEHFDILKYFDETVGSLLSGERVNKSDVIKEALKRIGNPPLENCIMVGDRSHDIIGAKENEMSSMGVLYGYGSKEELTEAKADYIVNNYEEIEEIVLKKE